MHLIGGLLIVLEGEFMTTMMSVIADRQAGMALDDEIRAYILIQSGRKRREI